MVKVIKGYNARTEIMPYWLHHINLNTVRENEEQMPFFEVLGNRIGKTICLDDSLNHNIQIRLVWKEHQRKRA